MKSIQNIFCCDFCFNCDNYCFHENHLCDRNGIYNSDESRIIDSIASVSQSVVGISVINQNESTELSWKVKDGIFAPYTNKDSIIKSLGSGLIYSNKDNYCCWKYPPKVPFEKWQHITCN